MTVSPPDPWQPWRLHIQSLEQVINSAQRALATAHLHPEQADHLLSALAPLGPLVGTPPPIPEGSAVPAELREAVARVGQLLSNLGQQVGRLDTANQRALSVLFPTEQLHTYAKLGGRTPYGAGPGRSSGTTHLKA